MTGWKKGKLAFVSTVEEYGSGTIPYLPGTEIRDISVVKTGIGDIFTLASRIRWEDINLPETTNFRKLVWKTLFNIGQENLAGRRSFADTLTSYGRLAISCGHPGASRAVGNAMAANPLLIVIPCHLVLPGHILRKYDGKTTDVGSYRLGSGMKAALIRYTLNISGGLPF